MQTARRDDDEPMGDVEVVPGEEKTANAAWTVDLSTPDEHVFEIRETSLPRGSRPSRSRYSAK